jgi:hypothetical protein
VQLKEKTEKLICMTALKIKLMHKQNKHATKQVDMQPQPKKYEATRHPTLLSQNVAHCIFQMTSEFSH